jgi:hypothetical protein
MSVDYVLAYHAPDLDAERHQRAVASPIELHCVATDVATAAAVDLSGMATKQELWQAILASSRMPWPAGPRSPSRAGASSTAAWPRRSRRRGARRGRHARPRAPDAPLRRARKSHSRLADRLIERHLRQLNPALVELYGARVAEYETTVVDIARRSGDAAAGPPHVLGLRPPAGTPVVGQLERRSAILARAAADAERLVEQVLGTDSLHSVRTRGPEGAA